MRLGESVEGPPPKVGDVEVRDFGVLAAGESTMGALRAKPAEEESIIGGAKRWQQGPKSIQAASLCHSQERA